MEAAHAGDLVVVVETIVHLFRVLARFESRSARSASHTVDRTEVVQALLALLLLLLNAVRSLLHVADLLVVLAANLGENVLLIISFEDELRLNLDGLSLNHVDSMR